MEKNKIYELALFIFRRDLRLIDNTALINASKCSKFIIPSFFLDERQINKNKNSYFSSNCVQFMFESLIDLNADLKKIDSSLKIFYGNLNLNLENIFKQNKIGAVYVNQDYTPFSLSRDKEIEELCNKFKVDFYSYEDLMLTNLNQVMTPKGEFFKIYTPYCQEAMKHQVRMPEDYSVKNFAKNDDAEFEIECKSESREIKNYDIESLNELIGLKYNQDVEIKGGRKYGHQIVNNMIDFKFYGTTRQLVKLPSTRLSAYLKFGCISIREIFSSLKLNFGADHELVKQLQWRDFFMKITYFYPHVIGNSFKPECDKIQWQAKPEDIEAWKKGVTGFPIVDAAMRCLNKTGYIHNKLRTMVCSFLVKDVLADWRIGEKYFANQLVDYDISLNNGGWQWTGSTGTDPRGEPRVYNPVLQSEKLDPQCEFILKWIPELKDVQINHIHDWEKYNYVYNSTVEYPRPIFSHYKQKNHAMKMFYDCKYMKNTFQQYNTYSDKSYNNKNYNSNKNYGNRNYSEKIDSNKFQNYDDEQNNNSYIKTENFKNNKYENQNKSKALNEKNFESYSENYKNKKKDTKQNNSQSIMNMIYGGKK